MTRFRLILLEYELAEFQRRWPKLGTNGHILVNLGEILSKLPDSDTGRILACFA
jgi:hypothetical protein